MNFDELNLVPEILEAVRAQGYTEPTPIQAEAIPAVLAGRDLLAGAQTGTGKTAAFTLPLLQRLSQSARPSQAGGGVAIRALVLTPTRELAAQVEESVQTYGKNLDIRSAVIFGGVGMNPQIQMLKAGVDVLVATPGRLLDLQQQGHLNLSQVQYLVLDEADRMLDMGFIHDVKKVLALLPKGKQSLLFSATFSDEIRELAQGLLRDPQHIQVTPPNSTVQRITQTIYPVGRTKKKALLAHIIQQHNWSQVLVFTRTKFGANNVADYLNKQHITAMALHGNKSQSARTQALAGFKSGEIRALVATDIAARGIDIDDLPHVVNYDIPNVCEDYVHRIGRTGRAGASGEAISLVSLDEEGFMMAIERFTRQQIPVQALAEFMPEPDEQPEPIAMGRQTIWGGAGKPPSRDVMAAAAKAARQEMMERMREKKGEREGPRAGGRGGQGAGTRKAGAQGQPGGRGPQGQRPQAPRAMGPSGGRGELPQGLPHDDEDFDDSQPPRSENAHRPANPARQFRASQGFAGNKGHGNRGARHGAGAGGGGGGGAPKGAPGGQPDPLRTGIDSLGKSGKRHGGGGGGGGRPSKGGGGGIDPLRTSYGRIR